MAAARTKASSGFAETSGKIIREIETMQEEVSENRNIGRRLAEERKRLELNASEMAVTCGVNAGSQSEYENAKRLPKADYLFQASLLGVDVLYVLTGRREPPRQGGEIEEPLSRILVLWADLPDAIRMSVVHLMETIASQKGGRDRS